MLFSLFLKGLLLLLSLSLPVFCFPLFSFLCVIRKKMRKPCCDKQGNNKGAWSKQEDQKLIDYITTHGEGCWRSLPKAAGLHRCGKSCRLRWINYLRPDIKRGNFAQDEEDLIIKLHALLGNRWSLIAGRLPGRTDNEVKNYWNSHIRKKLIKMGIDPNNHKLHQILPPPQQHHHVSIPPLLQDNTDNKFNDDDKKTKKSHTTDKVSDAASCLEDETSSSSDLNLDLSIAVPSPAHHVPTNLDTTQESWDTAIPIEVEIDTSPALILFV